MPNYNRFNISHFGFLLTIRKLLYFLFKINYQKLKELLLTLLKIPSVKISKSVFDFLNELKENNNRPWFNERKDRYLTIHSDMVTFADSLLEKMSHHDNIETMNGKQSLFRIYRDTRFSKNKQPYKNHWAGRMRRATKWLRGGYYYHIEPGGSFVAGGFWRPNSPDLKRIREELAADPDSFRKIINAPDFKTVFGELLGETVKTAPKGYSKDHPAIDLLRYKQFIVKHSFTDKEVLSADFADQMVDAFRHMRPFFDYMSDVLTTDSNGVPIED